MRRLQVVIALLCAAVLAVWVAGWGTNSGHLFGDPLLAREMMFAGEWFAGHGWSSYGLPVYRPGATPYTHLTPGPEWIQAAFAALRRVIAPAADLFRWHSLLTAALSAGALLLLLRSVTQMVVALRPADAEAELRARAAVLGVAATAAFIVYAAHPFCAGTLLGDVITFAAAASWAAAPEPRRWSAALAGMAAALFGAFWLGLAPALSGFIWIAASVLRFGEVQKRWRRFALLLVAASAALSAAAALKLLQSVALLGSTQAAIRDFRAILAFRSGMTARYSATAHLHNALLHGGYLFGLTLIAVALLAWRNRRLLADEWLFFGALAGGGLAWQVAMRGHAMFHSYMLREAMVPMAFALASLSGSVRREEAVARVRALAWCAAVNVAGVAAVIVIPLVLTGEPLWRLILGAAGR